MRQERYYGVMLSPSPEGKELPFVSLNSKV